jgi:hypothetical protein
MADLVCATECIDGFSIQFLRISVVPIRQHQLPASLTRRVSNSDSTKEAKQHREFFAQTGCKKQWTGFP